MPTEIKMPALSPTMEEGKLARWLVKEGDEVASGDIIAEIETDKATMEFEAVDEGVIASIAVAEGTEKVKVGTVIATLTVEGEEKGVPAQAGTSPEKAQVNEAPALAAAQQEAKPAASPSPAASAPPPLPAKEGRDSSIAAGAPACRRKGRRSWGR